MRVEPVIDVGSSEASSRLLGELEGLAKRARVLAQVHMVTTLMRKGGRPAQWIPESVLTELARIGLVRVLGTGACKLTPAGMDAARWLEAEARKRFPSATEQTVHVAMSHVLRGAP